MKWLFMWTKRAWTIGKDYAYAWNEKGQRFHALKSGRRQGRVNMIAAQCLGQLMAPFTVEGSCNRSVFEIWLETCLIPLLKPGQVVVIDNATFHKGGRIEQMIQQAGCELLYLPAYSPDFNKIERCYGACPTSGVLTALAVAIPSNTSTANPILLD